MKKLSPIHRLSLSLTLLVLSVMFTSEFLGLVPSRSDDLNRAQVFVAESLAVQVSAIASRSEIPLVRHVLNEFVERNDRVLSAAYRKATGTIIASAGDHDELWSPENPAAATPTHVAVPIYRNGGPWGQVEVRFRSIWASGLTGIFTDTSVGLFLFASSACFLLFGFLLRRALTELNPSRAVPDRVRAAFDVLAEGVIILDAEQRIVLANESIAASLDITASDLVGKRASNLPWLRKTEQEIEFPWEQAQNRNQRIVGARLELKDKSGQTHTFMINCGPILDSDGSVRGALATFDDMSDVERKNRELNRTLGALQKSREKISRKNKELETLARIDPLTGCRNRRSLFEKFDTVFDETLKNGAQLTCFMVDIDHFKRINDRYGHAVGDQVIRSVGEVLMRNSRSEDIVGRYGGEEFCVVSPNLTPDVEREFGERLRRAISVIGNSPDAAFPIMHITASIGFATLTPSVSSSLELVNQADSALYLAKESGRNRISRYDSDTNAAEALPSPYAEDDNVTYLTTAKPASQQLPKDQVLDDDAHVAELTQKVRALEDLAVKRADEIWHRSLHDSLTGLPNRVLLLDRATQDIKRFSRYGDVVAALSIEIETFQRINDTLGHDAADELIQEVTARLSTVVRNTDTLSLMAPPNGSTLSRIGSNEFVILLSELSNSDVVMQIVSRTREVLSTPFDLRGGEILFSGNIGISIFPDDAMDANSLLKNAATARGHARAQGRRLNVAFFSEEIQKTSTKQLQLEAFLHKAIDEDEFSLVYQPKMDVNSGRLSGVEALLRWQNSTIGNVSPMEFIPVAERSGLMPKISMWVLKTICNQLRAWQPLNIDGIRVALNISPVELRDPRLAFQILQVLEDEEISPSLLEIEITETAVIENMDTAVKTLQLLRDNGVALAIDDFGTGYSSLSHLTSLPLNVIKIDGCFMRDLEVNENNQAIVQAIIAMANTAGLRVVAEGIETEAELAVVRELGCHEVQGYLLGKPLRPSELTKLIIADANKQVASASRAAGLLGRWRHRQSGDQTPRKRAP